ncbi:MAG: sulfatase [Verrucomicrobiaceae bacterium]|nr:sulfatase [Verrucomicrobiaceae bacterium]
MAHLIKIMKREFKQLSVKNLAPWKELGLITCCYLLSLLPPFILEWWRDFSGVYYLYDKRNSYGIDTLLIVVLVAMGLGCVTEYFGRWRHIVFTLLIFFLVFLGMLATGHVVLYGAPISVGAIDALLGTDLHEAMEFLSFQWSYALAATCAGFAILLVGSVFWITPQLRIRANSFLPHGFAWPLFAVLVLAVYQHPAVAAQNRAAVAQMQFWSRVYDLNNQVPSLRILRNVSEWFSYREWLTEMQTQRAAYSFHATQTLPAPRTVVIVLGESMRRSNLSLYGYGKKTTPNLDARREQLLIFNRAVSAANQTVPSVTMMLTTASVLDPNKFLFEPSLLTAAKEAGYQTYWLSNQGRVGQFESKISLVAHDADKRVFTNTEFYGSVFDEKLLRPFQTALQDAQPLKLIVVHLQGSHQSYENRYPTEFDFFKEDQYIAHSVDDAKHNVVMAEYDNSIRYTDFLLGKIFAQLEKQPGSMLLFVSDHGERFYENGVASAGHGYSRPTKTEFQVPFFIWCNGGCAPDWKSASRQHLNLEFSTENVFQTGANMLGLQMDNYHARSDILSTSYVSYPPQVIATERNVLNYAMLP